MVQNKGLIFTSIPTGLPKVGEHLRVETRTFDENASPPEGGVTTRNFYASFDPYQRGRMRDPKTKSYSAPYQIGNVMNNSAISKILKSDSADFKEGDLVVSFVGAEEYSVVQANALSSFHKIENSYKLDPKLFIGALGMTGLTAYGSFYGIGEPKKGESIWISAASGAVGQIVGQLAKHEGLKVYGSVGDDAKLKYIIEDLGFDGGFNYKKEKPDAGIKRLAPSGIDIYYENVGGEHLEAAIDNLRTFGRVVVCGMISQYNLKPEDSFPIKNLANIVKNRLKLQGFLVGDPNIGGKYRSEHQEKMQKWISEGSFKARDSEVIGIDNAGDAFVGMLTGKNFGKTILKIADL